MNLPALEGDIILNDKGSTAFTKLDQAAQKSGRSLDQIQAKADRVASSLAKLDRAGGTGRGLGDAFDSLPTDGLTSLTDEANATSDAASNLQRNLDILGPTPGLDRLTQRARYLAEDIDDLSDRTNNFQAELKRSGAQSEQFASILAKIGESDALRSLPGGDQLANLSGLMSLLPRVSAGTIALAGGLGLVGAAVYGAYTGFDALLDRMDQMETKGAQKSKLAFFGDPDQAITDVQDALHERIDKDGVLQFLLKVDSTSALADIESFNNVAAAVQAHADKFGQEWQGALDIAIQAIQAGDGEALERLGLIKDADTAYRNYAEAIGKTVQQLSPYEKQMALANAVVEENAQLVAAGPSLIDAMNAAQERLGAKLTDSKGAIADYAVSLLAPEMENAASWWTQKLDGITNAVDFFEENLKARTEINKFAGSLTDDQMANWESLNAAIEETNTSLNLLRDQALEAQLAGNDEEAARIEAEVDKLDRKLEGLKSKRDGILADFKAGKDAAIDEIERPEVAAGGQVFLPTPGALLDAVTGDNSEKDGRTIADLTKQQLQDTFDLQAELEQKIASNKSKAQEVGESIVSSAIDGDANRVSRLKDQLAGIEAQIAKDEQTLIELLNDPALSLDPAFVAKAIGPQVQADAGKVSQAIDPQLMESITNTYGGIRDAIISGTNAKTEEVKQGTESVKTGLDELTQAILAWKYTVPQASLDQQLFLPLISSSSAVNESLTETSRQLDLVVQKAQDTGNIDVTGVAGAVTNQIAGDVAGLVNANPAGSVDPALIDALAGTYGSLTTAIVSGTNAKTTEVDEGVTEVGERLDALTQAVLAWQFAVPQAATGTQLFLPIIENAENVNAVLDETEQHIDDVAGQATLFEKQSVRLNATKEGDAGADKVTEAEDAVAAYNGLTRAQLEAAAASVTASDSHRAEATERAVATAAARNQHAALVTSIQLKAAEFEATDGLVGATGNLARVTTAQLTALALANNQMGDTTQVAGILFDSVSGLPVAFETAGRGADRLGQDLVALMNQMDALQTSAISAGFSIANRLVPSLGLAGSLQQAQKWASEAETVRRAIDQENAELVSSGRDPFGVEVTEAAMSALQARWGAEASDIIANQQAVADGAKSMADASSAALEQMNSALDGIISGVLKDSTQGLLPLDDLLPRADEVDEPARRMADVAVKGFQSPWFEGLKNLFPEDVLAQGEGAIKGFAAQMVRAHQEGLTTALYDVDTAAQKVMERIQAKQNQDDLVAQVREKVKGMAEASDLDIMEALGIDTGPERMAGAAREMATAMTVPLEDLLAQISGLSEGGSPLEQILAPSEENTEGIAKSGKDAMALAGEAMVTQAGEGNYGLRSINAMMGQIDEQEKSIKERGKKLAGWLGDALLTQFKEDVPKGLLDILVLELAPLMAEAAKKDAERTSGGGGN